VLHFAAADGRDVALAPLPLVTLMETAPGIRSVQLVQTSPQSVEVRLDPLPGHDRSQAGQDVRALLHEHLARHGLAGVRVVEGSSGPERDPRSGKLRQVLVASADQPGPARPVRSAMPRSIPRTRTSTSVTWESTLALTVSVPA
jgi:hypothetical protein